MLEFNEETQLKSNTSIKLTVKFNSGSKEQFNWLVYWLYCCTFVLRSARVYIYFFSELYDYHLYCRYFVHVFSIPFVLFKTTSLHFQNQQWLSYTVYLSSPSFEATSLIAQFATIWTCEHNTNPIFLSYKINWLS